MTSAIKILEHLRKYPVFGNAAVRDKTGKSGRYANLLIHRLSKRGLIRRIERDKYTVFSDPFLIASRVAWPSYITGWSGLKYHNLTEQVPQGITVATPTSKKAVVFGNAKIRFVKLDPKAFFGYGKAKYGGFDVFVADAEKSLIDSALLKEASFSELKEIISNNIKAINSARLVRYLKKLGNKSLVKRFGYAFEASGRDYSGRLHKYIDATYIPLDYSKKAAGTKERKWRVVVNA